MPESFSPPPIPQAAFRALQKAIAVAAVQRWLAEELEAPGDHVNDSKSAAMIEK